MIATEALSAVGTAIATVRPLEAPAASNVLPVRGEALDFASLLAQGIGSVDAKVAHADALVAQFAIDNSLPLHQVTIALEEARLAVEFAMQIRARLVEGYKELMNLQL